MRNSHKGNPKVSFNRQRVIHRSEQERTGRHGRKDHSQRSSSDDIRHQGAHRTHGRILRQLHASERHGNRDHIATRRRRNRRPLQTNESNSRHPNRRANMHNRRMERVVEGRDANQQDGSMKRRFRWFPPADFCESDVSYIVNVELAGVAQDAINLSVTENYLTIRGVKKPDRSDDNLKVRRSKRCYGRFRHTFPLHPDTVVSDIRADFKDGILTVVVPKPETAKPTEIPINAE